MDGQLYYYNRATGTSQWHLPNAMYESQLRRRGQKLPFSSAAPEQCLLVFPSQARAVLGVDCVTEALPSARASARSHGAGSARGLGQNRVDADPRDLPRLIQHLPPALTTALTGSEFEVLCLSSFVDVAGDGDEAILSLDDAVLLVGAIAGELRPEHRPPRLHAERTRQLAQRFEASTGNNSVIPDEFIELTRYILVVQYLEQQQGGR